VLWRVWSFLAGLPLGAAVGLLVSRHAGGAPGRIAWGAVAGGFALLVATDLLARWRDDETDRGRHLAAAASTGWLGLPLGAAIWLHLPPGGRAWIVLAVAFVAVALLRGARAIGPAAGPSRWLLRAGLAVGLGAVGALTVGAVWNAARRSRVSEPPTTWSEMVYDMDAAVATRPLPVCSARPRAERVLLDRGAHPSLSPDGRFVWFDAPAAADGGRRQIHRLDRTTGAVECWSCGEPGDNVRPAAGDSGLAVVFETDRGATWLHPDDTDIMLDSTRRSDTARRLTFGPGPDERPLLGPGSRVIAWSRRHGGRYEVVAAVLRLGHGGLVLGVPGVIVTGGAEWVAPAAWAPDGRTLVIVRGNPLAPVDALAIDPATGRVAPLVADAAPAASFDADGGWLALATAEGGHWGGALPDALGFVLAPWATQLSRTEPLLRGSGVRTGPSADPARLASVALSPALAEWGAPTGLALEPDGSGFVLGQRRSGSEGISERLVEVSLDCSQTASARLAGSGR
jgi:hypothetical protein